MEYVADRARNPFGIQPPTESPFGPDRTHVPGYGDANADVQVVGDHPDVHGGCETGIPFGGERGRPLRRLLRRVGLLDGEDPPEVKNVFLSYIHPLSTPDGRAPRDAEYAAIERHFDAEFRAINPHVVLPVGPRATDHVLREYTAQAHRIEVAMDVLHATELTGRGHLVIPVRTPPWEDGTATALEERLADTLARDYRQTCDLGRFFAGDEPYEVH